MSDRIEVKLSGRAPVRIDPDAWPVIAGAFTIVNEGRERTANVRYSITVRRHGDGRTIVTADRCPPKNLGAKAGAVIVICDMVNRSATAGTVMHLGHGIGNTALAQAVVASLPAEDLD